MSMGTWLFTNLGAQYEEEAPYTGFQKKIRNLIALKMTFLHHKWFLMAQNWHNLTGHGRQLHIRMGKSN